jgi:hypothetical protein
MHTYGSNNCVSAAGGITIYYYTRIDMATQRRADATHSSCANASEEQELLVFCFYLPRLPVSININSSIRAI